eukprot:scaffold45673_cov70-Cyclotella_meneghiniana.AAC.2
MTGLRKHFDGSSYKGEWCEGKQHGRGLYQYADGGSYDGEWCKGERHGRGVLKYADGGLYDGEWCKDKRHGTGLHKDANGSSYNGDWIEGKQHGRGLYQHAEGHSYEYDGEWCEGKKHGRGVLKYADGGLYDGEWCKDKRHGTGLHKDATGSSYNGDWIEGKQHGRGFYQHAEGHSYDGELCKGKKHGRGVLKFADGGSYDGEWCQDKRHGLGLHKYADGGSYDGEWCEDKKHGRGVLNVDGGSYDGEWCKGERHGRGIEKYADGSSYNGDWIEDLFHGRGVFKYADGSLYDGEWCEGKKHGRGVLKFADGSSYDGEWCQDKRHGLGLHKYADGGSYDGKWIHCKSECRNVLRIVVQDSAGLQLTLIVPADSKTSVIFSAYEEMTGKSPCRLKYKEHYIFYSQSKKKSLNNVGICNDDIVAVDLPVPTNMLDKYMTNHTATSSTEKPKVAKTKRQSSQQRRPWAGSVTDADSDCKKHSRQMNLVLKEIQPQLEQIRRHLNNLTLERTQPKDKTTTSKQAPANLEQIECRPDSVGIGSKAGKGSFVVNVGEANNLYKTSKHSKLIRSKPSICLDLHKLTKEQALAALNDSLPTWIETANSGMYPFVIQIRIICGKGSQTLSEVVMQWINRQQQVAHAPKQKQ